MTFTYLGDLSTDLDVIRFSIQDTIADIGVKPNGDNFTDEEISGLLTIEGTTNKTIAALYEALATVWASAVDTEIGSRKEKSSQAAIRYASLAKKWRDDYGFTSGLNVISVGLFDEGISQEEPT